LERGAVRVPVAVRNVVILRDPDGVFLELIERPPYASELAPPFKSPF
jgi:hypothetical protein